jgi:hypothetical protein
MTKPKTITYRITNLSMYLKEPECGILINS